MGVHENGGGMKMGGKGENWGGEVGLGGAGKWGGGTEIWGEKWGFGGGAPGGGAERVGGVATWKGAWFR